MVVILATKFTQIDKHFFTQQVIPSPAVPDAAKKIVLQVVATYSCFFYI